MVLHAVTCTLFTVNIVLSDSKFSNCQLHERKERDITLSFGATCEKDQSQGHLTETQLANEFCWSICIIIPNSQQLSWGNSDPETRLWINEVWFFSLILGSVSGNISGIDMTWRKLQVKGVICRWKGVFFGSRLAWCLVLLNCVDKLICSTRWRNEQMATCQELLLCWIHTTSRNRRAKSLQHSGDAWCLFRWLRVGFDSWRSLEYVISSKMSKVISHGFLSSYWFSLDFSGVS